MGYVVLVGGAEGGGGGGPGVEAVEEGVGWGSVCAVTGGFVVIVILGSVWFSDFDGSVPINGFMIISFPFCYIVAYNLVSSRLIPIIDACVFSFDRIFFCGRCGEEEFAGEIEDFVCERWGEIVVR